MAAVTIRPVEQSMEGPRERLLELHGRFPERYPALFDSAAAGSALSRYDILFAYPQSALWKDREGRVFEQNFSVPDSQPQELPGESPAAFLSHFERRWNEARAIVEDKSELPFWGGWLVFLGYEMAQETEPTLRLPPATDAVQAAALRIPVAVLYDRIEARTLVVAEAGHDALLDAVLKDLQTSIGAHVRKRDLPARALQIAEEDPQLFLDGVRRVQDFIRAGDIYQANLSRGWQCRLDEQVTLIDLYRRLRRSNPAPFAASFVWKELAILSSSPERLCEMRGGEIATRPIAGTRPRSRAAGADAGETAGLIAHPKERAEHVMLIDLERNDLGRICVPGSVRVDEFMITESYEHVHHIVSNVRGRLLPQITPAQIVRAVFPGGTITGCPKVRCMQIIAGLESGGRGAYTGSLGYLNHDGSGDFNILIRTLVVQNGLVRLRAGAGIVADSDAERELEETRAKAKGLLAALRTGEH